MKSLRFSLALLVSAFAFSNLARAEDPKPAGEPAACCKKSAANDKTCPHGCCTSAAKAGKNCEKCGGKNETQPKS